jgi:hypothetical protein
MKRTLAAVAISLFSAPAVASPLEKAASLLTQEELVRGEAQYVLEVNGDRKAACRLYRQAYQLGGDAYTAYPSEQTATVQYKSVFSLKEHCADLYPEFQKNYPLPAR